MNENEEKEIINEEESAVKENNALFSRKKYIILIGLIILMVIATIAVTSYAFFTISNKAGDENVITSGQMKLTLTDGPRVTAANMLPGQEIEKTFTVKNTGTVDTKYDIYLSEVINTFVDQTDLVYQIISEDGGYNTSSDQQVPATSSKIINQISIAPNVTHSYKLKIKFLNKDENQDDNQGAEFSAKINVNDYNNATIPAEEVTFDNSVSNITYNNHSVNNVQDALDAINELLS